MSGTFWYQLLVGVSAFLRRKVPVVDDVLSCNEQEIFPTTSLDKNYTEFEFQTDQNYYVNLIQTYLALKLKFVKGRGYETYNAKENKKDHRREAKTDEEKAAAEEEQEALVPLVSSYSEK